MIFCPCDEKSDGAGDITIKDASEAPYRPSKVLSIGKSRFQSEPEVDPPENPQRLGH